VAAVRVAQARTPVPYALLAAFSASIVLTGRSGGDVFSFYTVSLVAQVLFFLLAGVGALLELRARQLDEVAAAGDAAMEPVAMPPETPHIAREIA
jgi:hypothetical protein